MDNKNHHKLRGDWAEAQFLARATRYGLSVSKPWSDQSRYDFLVEHHGRISRVQVKSTIFRPPDGAYRCMVKTPNRLQQYTSDQIDAFALYVVPEDLWYIIPIGELTHARHAIALRPHNPKSKYHRFEEAWRLLRGPRTRKIPRLEASADPLFITTASSVPWPEASADAIVSVSALPVSS